MSAGHGKQLLVTAVAQVLLAVPLITLPNGYGQLTADMDGTNNLSEVRGRVVSTGNASYDGLMVEITSVNGTSVREHAQVSHSGVFWFRRIPAGDYIVRVLTISGDVLATASASAGQIGMPFEIHIPEAKLEKPPAGAVSVQELSHPPSKQARKFLDKGRRLMEEQHYDGAAEKFREAAKDDPDCPEVHADLAQVLSRMEDWKGATEEYRRAVALDPGSSILHGNLGAALAATNHFDEAERETATALKLDSHNARAHFVMAVILLRTHGPVPEAVSHLLSAQDTVPSAKSTVEKICAESHVQGCP